MYCGNCKYFSNNGICQNPLTQARGVAYFAPMCKDGNIPLPAGYGEPRSRQSHIRICKWCGREFPLEQFVKNAAGYTRVCKECKSELMRKAALVPRKK